MRKHKVPISPIALAFLTVSVALAFAAQDKYTVKVPGGLAFAEFRGYENWQSVGPSLTDAQNVIRVILANPVMIEAYREGVPGNGKPFPDGSKIAKIEWTPKKITDAPFSVAAPDTVPNILKEVEFIEKDAKRFPDGHGWGYAVFNYDPTSDKFTPATAADRPPQRNDAKCGVACHTWRPKRTTFSRRTRNGERCSRSSHHKTAKLGCKECAMDDLLNFAVDAHGGLKRWSSVEAVTLAASVGGDLWRDKSKIDYLKNVILRVETKRERVTMDFPGQDKRSVFEPNHVEMQRRDGTIVASRDNPEASFEGQDRLTPWDDIHVAYFSGEAFYTYCNTPFLCTYDGFASEEVPPIQVDGETWRRLKVIFPDTVKSHTGTQIFCFGPDGLLRRHDYTVDVLGGAPGLNYASDYRDIDGIIVPTKRRVYAYEGNYQRVKEPLLVQIDMADVALAYTSTAAVSPGRLP